MVIDRFEVRPSLMVLFLLTACVVAPMMVAWSVLLGFDMTVFAMGVFLGISVFLVMKTALTSAFSNGVLMKSIFGISISLRLSNGCVELFWPFMIHAHRAGIFKVRMPIGIYTKAAWDSCVQLYARPTNLDTPTQPAPPDAPPSPK